MGGRPVYIDCTMRALFAAGERGVTSREIADEIYADRADGGPLYAYACVAFFVREVRQRIAPYGANVLITFERGKLTPRGRTRYRLVTPRRA
jgi:hypothetical protein